MYEVLIVIYLIVALAIIGLVLIQQGKGADMGASFGSGASGSVFGSSGAGSFLTRSTGILATVFFVISLLLGSITAERSNKTSEFENLDTEKVQSAVPTATAPVSNEGSVPE